ncbi:MAG TPA: hypothetical protein V6D27_01070 [Vampirovibrionales bacterium]
MGESKRRKMTGETSYLTARVLEEGEPLTEWQKKQIDAMTETGRIGTYPGIVSKHGLEQPVVLHFFAASRAPVGIYCYFFLPDDAKFQLLKWELNRLSKQLCEQMMKDADVVLVKTHN